MKIKPEVLDRIAHERGWVHGSGRLAGTLNATEMATHLGVATSTLTRAYDTGSIGSTLLARLKKLTGELVDDLVSFEDAA